jgi:2-oxoisovalerate dehydrogenase E2 component (dihydrolipoyl transacylase)
VSGSGAGGRITEADVRAAADGDRGPASEAPPGSPRRTIAARLTKAAAVPTVTNVDDVDLEAVLEAGASPLVALARAVVVALADHPKLNAFAEEGPALVPQDAVHLGIAAQTDRGLVVPVVRDAQDLDLDGLAETIADVTGRARDGRTRPEELRGSTFTITSAGKLAGLFSTPLLNLPEVAILGIYRVEPRPVVRDGEVVVRRMSNLSITFDHRVLDGMDAAVFLRRVSEILETWPRDT